MLLLFLSTVPSQRTCPPVSCIRRFVFLNSSATRNPPYACRGATVTFYCVVLNGASLQWVSEPQICTNVPFSYTSVDVDGAQRVTPNGAYRANVISIMRAPPFSNFTSNLIFTPTGSTESVTVTCGDQLSACSSTRAELTVRYVGKCVQYTDLCWLWVLIALEYMCPRFSEPLGAYSVHVTRRASELNGDFHLSSLLSSLSVICHFIHVFDAVV